MDELIAIPLAEYNHLKRCEAILRQHEDLWHDEEVHMSADCVWDSLTNNKYSKMVYEQETTTTGV